MDKYIMKKSRPLAGTVKISGSKNSALPIMAASLLLDEECIIRETPDLSDVGVMSELLGELGVHVERDIENELIRIKPSRMNNPEASYELARQIRASFVILGPLLARLGEARIPLPGGCAIGARPVDLHLKGLAALGAEITNESGFVNAKAKKLIGCKIYLDYPSVGATQNIIMASVFAEGQTVIENCSVEPEVVDLANFLNSAGAEIRGAGTDTVKINGVKHLKGTEHFIIPDRIEAGTLMLAAVVTRGDVTFENIVVDHLKPVIAKLKEASVDINETENGLRVRCARTPLPMDIKTLPHPGFPTDMQAQFMSFLSTVSGTSIVTETVFENRFMQVGELTRMGADIKIEGRTAVVEGVECLSGAQVKASDLRAGAAMILAGLSAEGVTEINEIAHIDRGYCKIDKKLRELGAVIERIDGGA